MQNLETSHPSHDIPEGFRPMRMGGGFIAHNGPLHARVVDGRLQLGFRVGPQHVNPLKICHGGMLATFADMQLAMAGVYQQGTERRFLPTISLQMDYLAGAPLGAWVHGDAQVLRTTRNMVFVQALLYADGNPVVRCSGVFKMGPPTAGSPESDPLALLNS